MRLDLITGLLFLSSSCSLLIGAAASSHSENSPGEHGPSKPQPQPPHGSETLPVEHEVPPSENYYGHPDAERAILEHFKDTEATDSDEGGILHLDAVPFVWLT